MGAPGLWSFLKQLFLDGCNAFNRQIVDLPQWQPSFTEKIAAAQDKLASPGVAVRKVKVRAPNSAGEIWHKRLTPVELSIDTDQCSCTVPRDIPAANVKDTSRSPELTDGSLVAHQVLGPQPLDRQCHSKAIAYSYGTFHIPKGRFKIELHCATILCRLDSPETHEKLINLTHHALNVDEVKPASIGYERNRKTGRSTLP
ncbi:MAG TPA: hypothetical protein VGZ22_24280 [Isosphaeraceae bacterium]|jgi:hypothetical protein|nr:hypothetical protein [Isosphaeraceae bacterium]